MQNFYRLALIVAAATALTACAGIVRDRIYRPSDVVAAPAWQERAPLAVSVRTSDGIELSGLLWEPVAPQRDIIVYFHGNGGSLYRDAVRAEPLAAGGRGVLMTSYRGFSGNPGRPSEAGLVLDAQAFTDFARSRLPAGGHLYLFGHSLGGAVALSEAERRPVDGIATLGAFTRLADAAPPLVRGILPDRYDNLARIARPGPPVILFHGTADAIIPYAHGERLAVAGGARARLVPLDGGGHHVDMARLAPLVWRSLAQAPAGRPNH